MATRIETLGGGKRAPRAAWIMLFAIVMVAAALAIGTLVGSDGATTTAPRSGDEGCGNGAGAGDARPRPREGGAAATAVLGDPEVEAVTVRVPDGFVRMPGGELRPTYGS